MSVPVPDREQLKCETEMTGSLDKEMCEARGKNELIMRSKAVEIAGHGLQGHFQTLPVVGKDLAVGVRGKGLVAEVWAQPAPGLVFVSGPQKPIFRTDVP